MKDSDPPPQAGHPAGHVALTQAVRGILERVGPLPRESFACPYLPGRHARRVTVRTDRVAGLYHAFMDLNFRRLGPLFYRPECEGCSECRTLRVSVGMFHASRSQRRCGRRNRDLTVELGAPRPSPEKHDLYRRYLLARHDGQMDGSVAEFHDFLYQSCVDTVEIVYRLRERVVAVGIADREPFAWSAVYCFYDPEFPGRSLGVFNVLTLVDECRKQGVPHLYLGYYVRGCAAMAYKGNYRPCEVLGDDGHFAPLPGSPRRVTS